MRPRVARWLKEGWRRVARAPALTWRWTGRHRRGLLVAFVGGLVVLGVGTARLFVWPSTSSIAEVGQPDAVVLFVGGRGERLERALELMQDQAAGSLVIPNGTAPEWPDANRLCSGSTLFPVYCPTPEPDTTRGEARAVARLADREGWTSITLVTSEYHVSRARLLLSRCLDADLTVVGADSGLGSVDRTSRIAREWLGYLRARLVDRSC